MTDPEIIIDEATTVVEVDEDNVVVQVSDDGVTILDIGTVGPPGAPGIDGPIGPEGPPGNQGPPGGTQPFVYLQNVPATTWTISHGFGRSVAGITVYDTTGAVIEVGAVEVDLNTLDVTMVIPTAGKAVLE